MTADTAANTPDVTEEQKPKAPRARWSEPQIVRLSANKPEGCAALVLLTGLVACDIAHGTIDEVLRAPAGTTMKYLKTNAPVGYDVVTDEGIESRLLHDAAADAIIDKLVALKMAGAFTPRGLNLSAVLSVLMGTADLAR